MSRALLPSILGGKGVETVVMDGVRLMQGTRVGFPSLTNNESSFPIKGASVDFPPSIHLLGCGVLKAYPRHWVKAGPGQVASSSQGRHDTLHHILPMDNLK